MSLGSRHLGEHRPRTFKYCTWKGLCISLPVPPVYSAVMLPEQGPSQGYHVRGYCQGCRTSLVQQYFNHAAIN